MIMRIMTGRRQLVLGAIALLILLAAIAGVILLFTRRPTEVPLEIGEARYMVRVVSSGPDREKGLSGTAPLARDKGVLFVFDEDGQWGIWMKEMNYPIDILWLDSAKKVVHIVENALPSSYPATTYRPEIPARYVLELTAGSVDDATIAIGDQAAFDAKVPGGFKP